VLVILQVKVAVVGDGTVGKTSLVNSFSGSSFMEQYLMTIGVNIVVHKLETNNNTTINFAIWDLGGQPRFNVVRPQFYRGAQQIVYVYDISNKESFDNLTKWLQEVHKSCAPSAYKGFLVGNKLDLDDFRVIDFEEAKAFAETRGFEAYIETSAKDGTGTSELIDILADNVIERNSHQNEIQSPQNVVKQVEVVSPPSLTSFF
jgi:Ras-related protein Rab-1A